jgi:hypothetical protein
MANVPRLNVLCFPARSSSIDFRHHFLLAAEPRNSSSQCLNHRGGAELKREIPEQAKLRRITIGNSCAKTEPMQIELDKRAA